MNTTTESLFLSIYPDKSIEDMEALKEQVFIDFLLKISK